MGRAQVFMAGLKRSLIAAAALGLMATGCSAGSSIFTTAPEALPESMGGLPADAPAAPKDPYKYPAVHDMPPARSDKPLSDDQLLKMENDLQGTRDRQVDRAVKDQAEGDADFADTPASASPAPTTSATKNQPAKK
jgi:hypothetical protein